MWKLHSVCEYIIQYSARIDYKCTGFTFINVQHVTVKMLLNSIIRCEGLIYALYTNFTDYILYMYIVHTVGKHLDEVGSKLGVLVLR